MPCRSLARLPPHHPCGRRTAAGRAGLGAWPAGLARDTGILSPICRPTKRDIPPKLRWLPGAGRQDDRKSARLPRPVSHHTRRNQGRPERRPAPGHPDTCRVCRERLTFPGSRRFEVPWVSRSQVAGSWSCYGPDQASPKFIFDRGEPAPGMSDSRARHAGSGPRGPGAGPGAPHPRCDRPGAARGQGQPDPSRPWAGWPSYRPRGQAHL
jgi:hypothetical protein